MPADVYSERFLAHAGLHGTGSSVTVPAGHVYIVKQLLVYASPLLGLTTVFFEDDTTGQALFAQNANISEPVMGFFSGAIVFGPGQGFHWQVNNSFGEGADVYAGGYDLINP